MVKIVCKIINLSLPNLACFAPWRESIPAFEYFRLPENLRELRKFSKNLSLNGAGRQPLDDSALKQQRENNEGKRRDG